MVKSILPVKLKDAAYVRNVHHVVADPNTNPNDVLAPEYFKHCTKKVKQGDHIEVVAQEGTWFMQLFVREVLSGAIKVAVLNHKSLSKPTQAIPFDEPESKPKESESGGDEEYEVKFSGQAKFRVIRLADKEVLATGIGSKEAAEQWLADYKAKLQS